MRVFSTKDYAPNMSSIPKIIIAIPTMRISNAFPLSIMECTLDILINRKTGRMMAIMARIIPAKFRTRIKALGTNIATVVAGTIINNVDIMRMNLTLLAKCFRSFSRISFRDNPTPIIDVIIAKNETTHAAC
jgi:hypothetical protein